MKLAGAPETGWIAVDLRHVAQAIDALRGTTVRLRAQQQAQRSATRLPAAP